MFPPDSVSVILHFLWWGGGQAVCSFTFCFSERVFISPLFLKDIFPGYRILDWLFFHHFKDTVPLFRSPIVSDKKSAIISTVIAFFVTF